MLTISRILFFSINHTIFPQAQFTDFLAGIWIDAITIGIWFIPYYSLYLFPNPYRNRRFYPIVARSLFHLTNGLMLGFNMVDLEYFRHTSKRSTADLLTIMGTGDDLSQLIGAFLADFWWIIALLLLLVYLSDVLYKRTLNGMRQEAPSLVKQSLLFIVIVPLLFIIGRGGLGLRPADPLSAAQYTRIENTGLVLNTPFTMIKTIGKESLKEVHYFSDEELHLLYNPIKLADPSQKIGDDLNIMVIILESFGNEWIGKKTGGPFTPFLDSLIDHSLYFENGFANGKKSIEAVPAIFAGIPSLQDDPYITSHYGTNTIDALPLKLKRKGYSSAFFHGATNGSMKFDKFSVIAGFDHYYGRTEYNNDAHFDGHWGIWDEHFMRWAATTISTDLTEPFIASIFTLSSHHPYSIPDEHRPHMPVGDSPIAASIAYADLSLSRFFEAAQQQSWYENTLFVICADHTPAGIEARYNQRIGMYQIPILFFDPQQRIQPNVSPEIFSQIDIFPTLLDLIGYEGSFYTFGNSYFQDRKRFAVNYIEGTYHLFKQEYILNFYNDRAVNLYNFLQDPMMEHDSLQHYFSKAKEYELLLKGVIQRYNHDLIHNQMTVGE